MKVSKRFFCVEERRTYYVGDEYTGKRKDIAHLLEKPKKTKSLKPELKTKPVETKKED